MEIPLFVLRAWYPMAYSIEVPAGQLKALATPLATVLLDCSDAADVKVPVGALIVVIALAVLAKPVTADNTGVTLK